MRAIQKVGGLAVAVVLALAAAGCGGDDDGGAGGTGGGKQLISLLLPESKTTRYEQQDRPNFERKVKELCPNCEVLYSNAQQDPAKQQAACQGLCRNHTDRHTRSVFQVGHHESHQ